MESHKLYTDCELNIEKLSSYTGIHRNKLSRIINSFSGKSFNQFINTFRITYIKTVLTKEELHDVSILNIGFKAGFGSKATLNRAFKEIEGVSPSEYKQRVLKE